MLRDKGLDFEVARLLKIEDRLNLRHERKSWAQWCDFTDRIDTAQKPVTIAITGKYTSVRDSYASIINSLEHAGIALGAKVDIKWIETTGISDTNVAQHLADVDGIIVPGGFGTRGAEGKICCVKHARENNLPYLGICFGFQMAVIEFARNVCGLTGANSTEIDKDCENPVIDYLPEQLKIEGLGGNMHSAVSISSLNRIPLPGSCSRRHTPSECVSGTATKSRRDILKPSKKQALFFQAKLRDNPLCKSSNCHSIPISWEPRRIPA